MQTRQRNRPWVRSKHRSPQLQHTPNQAIFKSFPCSMLWLFDPGFSLSFASISIIGGTGWRVSSKTLNEVRPFKNWPTKAETFPVIHILWQNEVITQQSKSCLLALIWQSQRHPSHRAFWRNGSTDRRTVHPFLQLLARPIANVYFCCPVVTHKRTRSSRIRYVGYV